ncbi:hypothetical protein [Myxococcus sp. CA040A]|nr:hypothetical protein [Myxococcus sp. CA040A]
MEGIIDGLKAQAKIEVKEDALEQLTIEGAENKPAAPAPPSQPHP